MEPWEERSNVAAGLTRFNVGVPISQEKESSLTK